MPPNTQYSQPQTYQYFLVQKPAYVIYEWSLKQFVWALKICSSRAVEVGNYSEVPLRLLFRGKVIYQSLSDFGRHVRLCQMAFRILRTALLIVLGWPHHIGLTFPIFVSLLEGWKYFRPLVRKSAISLGQLAILLSQRLRNSRPMQEKVADVHLLNKKSFFFQCHKIGTFYFIYL